MRWFVCFYPKNVPLIPACTWWPTKLLPAVSLKPFSGQWSSITQPWIPMPLLSLCTDQLTPGGERISKSVQLYISTQDLHPSNSSSPLRHFTAWTVVLNNGVTLWHHRFSMTGINQWCTRCQSEDFLFHMLPLPHNARTLSANEKKKELKLWLMMIYVVSFYKVFLLSETCNWPLSTLSYQSTRPPSPFVPACGSWHDTLNTIHIIHSPPGFEQLLWSKG